MAQLRAGFHGTVAQSTSSLLKGGVAFDRNRTEYLHRTPSTAGNQMRWTWSCWIQRTHLDGGSNFYRIFGQSEPYHLYFYENVLYFDMGSASQRLVTSQLFRDVGWYHLVAVFDSANGTSGDRMRLYLNGSEITAFSTESQPSQNTTGTIDSAAIHTIAYRTAAQGSAGGALSANMSEIIFCDSAAFDASYFGYTDPLTGIWRPKNFKQTNGFGNPNNGTTWSSNGSVSGNSGSATKTFDLLFDGKLTTYAEQSGDDVTLTWTPSPAIRVNKTMRINFLVGGSPADTVINSDTSAINVDPATGWVDVPVPGGGMNFSKFEMPRGGSGVYARASAIEIDGYIMVNGAVDNSFYLPCNGDAPIGEDRSGNGNHWTAVHCNALPLDKATGALPILNTTSDGKIASSGVRIGTNDTPKAVTESGCVLFDGSNDYLIGSDTSELLNDADWTVDGWFYLYEAPSSGGMIMLWDSGGGGNDPELGIWHNNSSSPGTIQLYQSLQSGTGWDGPSIEAGNWYYFKETVDGSSSTDSSAVYKLYLDGALCNTTTINLSSRSASSTFGIGCRTNGSQLWKGAISNLRYREVVDNSLGVPDVPFATDSDTKLLCCQSSTDDTAATTIPTGSLSATGSPDPSTDEFAGMCRLAVPLGPGPTTSALDVSHWVNGGSTEKLITNHNSTGSSLIEGNFYNGSFEFNGSNKYLEVKDGSGNPYSDFAFGSNSFTCEAWVYANNWDESYNAIFNNFRDDDSTTGWSMLITSGGLMHINIMGDHNNGATVIPTQQWVHLAMCRDGSANKCYRYINGVQDATTNDSTQSITNTNQGLQLGGSSEYAGSRMFDGYMQDVRIYNGVRKYTSNFVPASPHPDIQPISPSGVSLGSKVTKPANCSVSFSEGGSPYMDFDPGSDIALGTGDFTIEAYVYHTGGADDVIISDDAGCSFLYGAGGTLRFYMAGGSNLVSSSTAYISNRWVHVAAVRTSGTLKMFQDGEEVYSASYTHNISTFTNPTDIGSYHSGSSYWCGFINSLRVTVGQALYTASYEPPTEPLTTTSQSATASNVKLLCCQDPTSPTTATVTPNGITAYGDVHSVEFNPFDSDTSIPPTHYPTLNPLFATQSGGTGPTYKDGLLYLTGDGDTGYYDMCACASQLLPLEGKFMFEYKCLNTAGTSSPGRRDCIGVYDTSKQQDYLTNIVNSVGFQSWDGDAVTEESDVQGTGLSWYNGAVASCAIDCTTGQVWFATNGNWIGDPVKGTGEATTLTNNGDLVFCESNIHNTTAGGYDSIGYINFGQRPFTYSPPEGFGPLCAANDQQIGNPQQYFKPVLYTGNDAALAVEVGFQPDLVVMKNQGQAYYWGWYDSVRGTGTSKSLYSNTTEAEGHNSTNQNLTGFTPTGFTLGATSSTNVINTNGHEIMGYCWKAGGNKGTFNRDGVGYDLAATAGLSAGDTTINGASIGTKQGFSIIKYTGPNDTSNHTVAHGLNQAPDFVVVKNLDDGSANWNVYHSYFDSGDYMTMTADATTTNGFNGVPTSTVINTQHDYSTDETDEFIAYCWHNVPGLQKVGKYISNNNANGPLVLTGFRPAQVVLRIDGADGWHIFDNKRDPYNGISKRIWWNSNAAQSSNVFLDFLADGFKLRANDGGVNGSATTYYYIAWADQCATPIYGGQSNAY